jgi:hypothetical protein
MKHKISFYIVLFIIVILASILLIGMPSTISADQGRAQNSHRSVPHASRSPSMSRSAQNRPPQQQRPQQQKPSSFPQGKYRPPSQSQQQQPRQTHVQQNSQINKMPSSFQPPTVINSDVLHQQQVISSQGKNSRTTIKNRNPGQSQWFSDGFYQNHNHHPHFHNHGANWWNAASWAGVTTWLTWGWNDPYYYSDSGITYSVPQQDYQTSQEVQYAPPSKVDDWMPLGVFAAGHTPADTAYTSMYVQLALDKQGNIAGTYYNTASDEVHDISGQVNRYTQEATWKISDNPSSPTMTTGIYNLTQEVAIVQVSFQDGSNQNWTLVRLNK